MGRQRCSGCERPLSVCLCPHIPCRPFHNRTTVVVLQHPHEARHRLSTLPVLCKCLANCLVLQGRRLARGACPLLDRFSAPQTSKKHHHALLLFPSYGASPVDVWFAHHQKQREDCSCSEIISFSSSSLEPTTLQADALTSETAVQNPNCFKAAGSLDVVSQRCSTNCSVAHPVQSALPREDSDLSHLVLIAIDATWQHATEMIKASAPYLSQFAIPVCLPYDAEQKGPSIAESAVTLRKEPFKGCMSTLEAIASCLKVLEPNGGEIYDQLLAVLQSMVQFQVSHIFSHKVRRHEYKNMDVNAIP